MAKDADIGVFKEVRNELHPSLKFIVVKRKTIHNQKCDTLAQVLNFKFLNFPKWLVRNRNT